MTVQIPAYSERVLAEYAQKEWNKVHGYLKKHFGLSDEDCDDVFQESFIVLFNNNREGKMKDMGDSLSTYFTRICHNKALELLRRQGRYLNISDDNRFEVLADAKDEKLSNLITLDPDVTIRDAKEAIARQIVRDLPEPCNKLLWGFFRDNHKLKTLAEMLNKTEGYVKVTKHRCQEKFRRRWHELVKDLF